MPAIGDGGVYPIFLKLEGRRVLVVGAGSVAERKIAALVSAKARVDVVAPKATEAVRRLASEGAVDWRARSFDEGDVEGAWLVVAATGDGGVQRRVAEAASARQTFVIAVDDVAHATAYSGAIVARPPFTVAISSSGETPALTRLVREIIEDVLPPDDWVERAKAIRARWIAAGTPPGDRFGQLVSELAARSRV
ncbi:MAG: bifunctional precorrin-2 dehydrogenase/sirohydrochlorin ferrochelatase [Polyangiaceae bacterium]|nr:bifunctional precorrin-2 dehydrogenase/sirohydrochlorin ferrochelatase [Polyangiaceae bacterium]